MRPPLPFSVHYNAEVGAIETLFYGTVTAEEVQAEMAESHSLSAEAKCKRFLADLSQATITISVSAVYNLPASYEEMGGERPVRVAIIPPADGSSREMLEFYRNVGINRGWTVEIVSDRDQAIEWLNK